MDSQTRQRLLADATRVEKTLHGILDQGSDIPPRLKKAMEHSLFSGGKRLRPILLIWSYQACRSRTGSIPKHIYTAAAALEMIHTYSLIHDDLPAMDDDQLRRGQPTCHVLFDEATAILAGDGLQSLAFETLGGIPVFAPILTRQLARAAGPAGMVGGQHEDLDNEGKNTGAGTVERIHDMKTAALIACSLTMGAVLAGKGSRFLSGIEKSGRLLGRAFQAADDLLDISGQVEDLGKTPGKDVAAGKSTWIALEGYEKAALRTRKMGEAGARDLEKLIPVNPAAKRLLDLVHYLWTRTR